MQATSITRTSQHVPQIHKSVWRVRSTNAKHVALQFPEGLLMYACIIADILERYEGPARCMSTTLPCSVALCIHEPPTTCGCTATTAPSALLV